MRNLFLAIFAVGNVIIGTVHAQSIDGNWKFTGAKEYFGETKLIEPLRLESVQILDGKIAISPSCVADFKPEPYYFSMNFQSYLRQKITPDDVSKYFREKLDFPLSSVKVVYKADVSDCSKFFEKTFIEGDRMVAVYQATTFYTFSRVAVPPQPERSTATAPQQRMTSLPFNLPNYVNLCQPKITVKRGATPLSTVCAPAYYPYVASPGDKDPITAVVGRHKYSTFRDDGNGDYDQPFLKGLRPVYLVLPPINEISVVRVDDIEHAGDKRDPFSGAYLTIKSGKVIDQLNEGCSMKSDYSCVDRTGKPIAHILPSGKFHRN